MYLTRMYLNPARRGTRYLLASPQRMHAAVLSAFPPDTPVETERGRVLWRVDHGQASNRTLYLSSPTEPELTHVVEQAGWPAGSQTWQTVEMSPLLNRLATGQEWAFRLTANPVRYRRPAGGSRGKPQGHVTVAQQEQWLRQRAPTWGFEVHRAAVTSRRTLNFDRRSTDTSRSVTVSVATFDGLLKIVDPQPMRIALRSGVGRAKGYGCGLITLAPIS